MQELRGQCESILAALDKIEPILPTEQNIEHLRHYAVKTAENLRSTCLAIQELTKIIEGLKT